MWWWRAGEIFGESFRMSRSGPESDDGCQQAEERE